MVVISSSKYFIFCSSGRWWIHGPARGDGPAPGVVAGLDGEGAEVLHRPQHADDALVTPPGEGVPPHRLGEDRVQGVRRLLCQVSSCLRFIWETNVKHFLFARTLFSRKFARAKRRENKVIANNFFYKNYGRRYDESRKWSLVNKSWLMTSRK